MLKRSLFFAPLFFLLATKGWAQGGMAPCGETQCRSFAFDSAAHELRLLMQDESGRSISNAAQVEQWASARREKLLFATNSGIFSIFFRPLGLHAEAGKLIVPLNLANGEGNFYLKPNGVFSFDGSKGAVMESSEFRMTPAVMAAVQSGPLLVRHSVISPNFRKNSKNRLKRSGVGVRKDGAPVFAISDDAISFYEFALYFRDTLGCEDALFLDGIISQAYFAGATKSQATGGRFAAMFAILAK